jgi:hypothetical protein
VRDSNNLVYFLDVVVVAVELLFGGDDRVTVVKREVGVTHRGVVVVVIVILYEKT